MGTQLINSDRLTNTTSRLPPRSIPRTRSPSNTFKNPPKPIPITSSTHLLTIISNLSNIPINSTSTSKYITTITNNNHNRIRITFQEKEESARSTYPSSRCTHGESSQCRCPNMGIGDIIREANGEISGSIRFIRFFWCWRNKDIGIRSWNRIIIDFMSEITRSENRYRLHIIS